MLKQLALLNNSPNLTDQDQLTIPRYEKRKERAGPDFWLQARKKKQEITQRYGNL